MAKSQLKQLAATAKKRMMVGYAPDEECSKSNLPTMEREDKRIYAKVVEFFGSDEVITNPLGRLIEREVFDRLSSAEKERYILELSKNYIRQTSIYLERRRQEAE